MMKRVMMFRGEAPIMAFGDAKGAAEWAYEGLSEAYSAYGLDEKMLDVLSKAQVLLESEDFDAMLDLFNQVGAVRFEIVEVM